MPNLKEGKHAKFEVICVLESTFKTIPETGSLAPFQNTTWEASLV